MKDAVYIPSQDDRHCTQAAFRMALATLLGTDPGELEADRLTGYVDGSGTWQFQMLLALGSMGIAVVDHELFDPDKFLLDPEKAIRDQVADPIVAEKTLRDTDIPKEVASLAACLDSGNVEFINSIPSLNDLELRVNAGELLLISLNRNVLDGVPGHTGHMVVVNGIAKEGVRMHDPGPPANPNRIVSQDLFNRAWKSPSGSMANYIALSYDLEV